MQNNRQLPLGHLLLVGCIGILSSCGKEKAAPLVLKPRPVVVYEVPDHETGSQRRFAGETKAARSVDLGFEVSGRIIEIKVTEGTRCHKGQVLAKLDPASYIADLNNATAQALQAVQQLRRTQELFESGNGSQADFDTAIAAQKATKAVQESAQLAVEYTVLKMPYEGIVAAIPADVNQVLSAGTPVISIQGDEGMDFEVGVPAETVSKIHVGLKAQITLGSLPEKKALSAEVTKVSPLASSNTTYPVTLRIDQAASMPEIRAGLDGEALFSFSLATTKSESFLVPSSAVSTDPEGHRYVWVVSSPKELTSAVQRLEVEVGALADGGKIQLLKGVEAGQVLVSRGSSHLVEGMKVSLLRP